MAKGDRKDHKNLTTNVTNFYKNKRYPKTRKRGSYTKRKVISRQHLKKRANTLEEKKPNSINLFTIEQAESEPKPQGKPQQQTENKPEQQNKPQRQTESKTQ